MHEDTAIEEEKTQHLWPDDWPKRRHYDQIFFV